ncbi:MAG: DUF4432 family protein [Ruminococcaceae bacterium]|nr:DUF4432 family protein [Oscillospiraceae bacterium]
MTCNPYIGHSAQISGVEEVTLAKGRGKGMTLLEVRNGKGLTFTLSADRAMDISRLSLCGVNMGFFAPCGYVAPTYYDNKGAGFLKSFTAGFLTTCGLEAAGQPCVDEGEELPLHGSIANTPCENYSYRETETEIIVEATVREARLFGRKMILNRTFTCSKIENMLTIEDSVFNEGSKVEPCMLLYHFNMGYPLLSETAKVVIPAHSVQARNAHAQAGYDDRLQMEKPQADYEERCYFYDVVEQNGMASVGIFNGAVQKGLIMSYDKSTLDCFTQWKMMGEGEYVLGLEPSNCTPDGRDVMRREGILKFVEPKATYKTKIVLQFTEQEEQVLAIEK